VGYISSGVQEELSKISAALEKEKQAHEDTRAALKKAKEAAHRVRMTLPEGHLDGPDMIGEWE